MLKVFEAFAGIGTQTMALRNQNIEHEVTAISEVDEYALLSYYAIHTADVKVEETTEEEMQKYMEKKNIPLDPKGKRKILKNKRLKDLYVASVASNNLGDISKIIDEEIPRVDLFTYSFPCQDISLAGQQHGLEKGSGTRSSLLWECEKIIETVKPKYLLMENVKALVNKNNKPQIYIWLEYLEELGYKNFWQVLNAKDYGIPQNRERVFVVSILDKNADYKFPAKIPLELKLKDILEDNVDDSYYLSQEQVDRITFSIYNTGRTRIQEKDYSDTLCARDFKDPKYMVKQNLEDYELVGTIYSSASKKFMGKPMKELSKTLKATTPDTAIVFKKKNDNVDEENKERIIIGSTQKNAAAMGQGGGHVPMHNCTSNFKVRKLTPKECWRLMGIRDEDFEKASKVVSNAQLYKQAGNAIVVDVLEGIFEQLLKEKINDISKTKKNGQ